MTALVKKGNNHEPDHRRRIVALSMHTLNGVKHPTVQKDHIRLVAQMISQSRFTPVPLRLVDSDGRHGSCEESNHGIYCFRSGLLALGVPLSLQEKIHSYLPSSAVGGGSSDISSSVST